MTGSKPGGDPLDRHAGRCRHRDQGPARPDAGPRQRERPAARIRGAGGRDRRRSSRSGRRAPAGRRPARSTRPPARNGAAWPDWARRPPRGSSCPAGSSTVSRRPLSGTTRRGPGRRSSDRASRSALTSAMRHAGGVVAANRAVPAAPRQRDPQGPRAGLDPEDARPASRVAGELPVAEAWRLEIGESAASRWHPPRPADGRSRSRCPDRRRRPPLPSGASSG